MTAQAARSYWMYNNGNQIALLRYQAKIINDRIIFFSNMTLMKKQQQGLSSFKRLFEVFFISKRGNGCII